MKFNKMRYPKKYREKIPKNMALQELEGLAKMHGAARELVDELDLRVCAYPGCGRLTAQKCCKKHRNK